VLIHGTLGLELMRFARAMEGHSVPATLRW
jgi:hypothetical protein